MSRILIIDDDRAVCKSLELLLRKAKYEATSIHHPAIVTESIEDFRPSLIILDLNFTIDTSGRQGLKILKQIMEQAPSTLVILMTGWGTLQLAVEGMKQGAKDFLTKPWDNKHLLSSIDTALSLHSPVKEMSQHPLEQHIIGKSKNFLHVLHQAHRIASTDANVLITGESGTGKEIIAEAIHSHSKRSDETFVKVNLGGISSSLFESEMFGHKKGAFTDASMDREGRFAKADGGTIFLDEIGDLALESQVKLLRVLQEKTYEVLGSSKTQKTNVRVVSATNRLLEQMVADGTFREDLYYRINLINLHLPALSDRREDIPLLINHFMSRVGTLYEVDVPDIEKEALRWLEHQSYPGNVRQLKNIVERTVLLAQGKKDLNIRDFQDQLVQNKEISKVPLPEVGKISLEEMERQMIIKALAFHNQSISKTSRSLGITRSSLYRRIEKYGILLS